VLDGAIEPFNDRELLEHLETAVKSGRPWPGLGTAGPTKRWLSYANDIHFCLSLDRRVVRGQKEIGTRQRLPSALSCLNPSTRA